MLRRLIGTLRSLARPVAPPLPIGATAPGIPAEPPLAGPPVDFGRIDRLERRADRIEDTLRTIDVRFEAIERSIDEGRESVEGSLRHLRDETVAGGRLVAGRLAEVDGYRMARAAQLERQQRLGEQYMRSLVALVERVDAMQSGIDELQQHLIEQTEQAGREAAAMDTRLQDRDVAAVARAEARFELLSGRQAALDSGVDGVAARVETLARAGAGRTRLLASLTETVNRLVAGIPIHDRPSLPAPVSALDALYLEFEDRARGSRDEIKRRQAAHLPLVSQVGAGTAERPVLDIGAGRGEWLELLGEHGLSVRGIDLNGVMVSLCRELGLPCEEGDALSVLRALPAESIGLLSGFHIIEHLPFEAFVGILDEALRVLRPGGAILLETPDPANVLVGSHKFYLDPTHRNPMPSELVRIIAEARGYTDIEILRLHPTGVHFQAEDKLLAAQLDALFYGTQDYALFARKR